MVWLWNINGCSRSGNSKYTLNKLLWLLPTSEFLIFDPLGKIEGRVKGIYGNIAFQLYIKIILHSFTQSFSKHMYYHSLCWLGAEERKILRWSENYWAQSSVVTYAYWQMPNCLSMVLLKFCLWKKWHNGLENILDSQRVLMRTDVVISWNNCKVSSWTCKR